MGIYDRDYYREETQGVFLSGPWSAVGSIIAINVVVHLATSFLPAVPLNDYLALHANTFQKAAGGEWLVQRTWFLQHADGRIEEISGPMTVERLREIRNTSPGGRVFETQGVLTGVFTHGFAHGDMVHILFNMLMLFTFGRDVEGIYGKRLFWRLYLSLVLTAGLGWLLAENFVFHRTYSSAVGASGAVMGLMIVYVLHFPRRMLYFLGLIPAPAWLLAAIFVGWDLYWYQQEVVTGRHEMRIAHAAHLVGALFGAIFFRFHWTLFSILPTRWLRRLPRRAKRDELRVVYEPNDDDLDEQVDRILAKISRYGTDSLTEEEHRTLEAASKRAQRKRGVRSD